MLEGRLTQIRATRDIFLTSHCLYADDIHIFCQGSLTNVRNIMKLFETCDKYSRQMVNASKSKFYSGAISLSLELTLSVPSQGLVMVLSLSTI